MDEEMEGLQEQLCEVIEILYEDQHALIIIGETEQDGDTTNFNVGGTSVIPVGGSTTLLANIICAAMEKNDELRGIIRLALMLYDEDNRPTPICLN